MTRPLLWKTLTLGLVLLSTPTMVATTYAQSGTKPLKVFILVGQSNMQGHAKVETFDYIGDDPATAPLLDEMRDSGGKPRVCDNVWISYLTGARGTNGEGFGKLTAGYGARKDPATNGGKIGPEFTFGIYMDKALEEPILIIKTAWGGKSLFLDFRPPSAGPYQPTARDIEKEKVITQEMTGLYYRLMMDHVNKVLKDIKRVCPAYDEKRGYEIAGFIWFQGFNDKVNHNVYPDLPKGSKQNTYAKYSEWMAGFIRDVRKDLNAEKMPFIIGVIGVGGTIDPTPSNLQFREAMAAPAAYAEFQGNVAAVQTAPFWDDTLGEIADKRQQLRGMKSKLSKKVKAGEMTKEELNAAMTKFEAELISPEETALLERGASNAAYHYLGCAKTFALMGKAYADAMLDLMRTAAAPSDGQ